MYRAQKKMIQIVQHVLLMDLMEMMMVHIVPHAKLIISHKKIQQYVHFVKLVIRNYAKLATIKDQIVLLAMTA